MPNLKKMTDGGLLKRYAIRNHINGQNNTNFYEMPDDEVLRQEILRRMSVGYGANALKGNHDR